MTDQQYSITPPPELIEDWIVRAKPLSKLPPNINTVALLAARWGADTELEACKQVIMKQQWFAAPGFRLDQLHNARRPKPPSLKEQALALINHDPENQPFLSKEGIATIRRAIEALPND